MKRTTISLPDDLAAALEREARRRRLSVSHVVREGLEAHLGRGAPTRRIPFAAVGRSGTHDTARNVDRILEAEWDRDRDR
jgi:Arc/MetJ-type ribon-helix-helix transcriptional regulator